ncbi:MAG: hypothetical protein QXL15_03015 [Candidatus Korarchaeota archaeon]
MVELPDPAAMYKKIVEARKESPSDEAPPGIKKIICIFKKDNLHIMILQLLLDCEWHSSEDIWRSIRKVIPYAGIVRISNALSWMRDISEGELIQCKQGKITLEWRLNGKYKDYIAMLIDRYLKKGENV